MKKNFLVHAYLCKNLGDDLFVRILCNRYPKARFHVVLDEAQREHFKDVENLIVHTANDFAVKFHNKWMALRKKEGNYWNHLLKTCDGSIHIGGSVFTQHLDDYSAFFNMDAKLANTSKAHFMIGGNFGPFTNPAYLEDYKALFPKYKGLVFRDSYSAGMFPDFPNITYASDVVFQYENKEIVSRTTKTVAISIIALEHRGGKYSLAEYAQDYYKAMAYTANYYIDKGYKVNFLSFCEFEHDTMAYAEICKLLPEEKMSEVSHVCYRDNLNEILQAIADCDYLIGTRFHSVILGFLYGKRVLPIVYGEKTSHVLEDMNFDFSIDIKDMNLEKLETMLNELEKREAFDISYQKKDSARQFMYLDKYIK